jgi:hypothetical protein
MAEVDPQTLVFLDETSTQIVMARPRARAPRGQRAVARIPPNHGHNVTCLAAITPDGVTEPLVFEGALDGPLFARWLTERLLLALGPGHVLDNLSVHKHAAARTFDRLVDAIGAAFDRITPAHIQACSRHCGYGLASPH